MRLLTVSAALLLAFAPLVSRASYTPVEGPPVVSASVSLGLPSAAAFPSPASALTVTCALLNFGVPPGNAFRDGYAGFVTPLSSELADALAAVSPGTLLPLQPADVDGLLVRVMTQLQTEIGFTLRLALITPPANLLPPISNSTDAVLMYAFHAMNATCALHPSPSTPTRRLYMRQSVPLLSFGYQVVTTRPTYKLPTTAERVFYWTHPFSPGVWALLTASIVAAAAAMPLFERGGGDFSTDELHSIGERVGHAVYLAAMGPAKPDTFEPTTAGGRTAAALHAFSLLLIISSYTANLAAQFTTSQPPVQRVTGPDSFGSALPVCVRSSSVVTQLLNASYPAAFASLKDDNIFGLSTYGSGDALRGVLRRQCAGALLPATEVAWLMGVNDTGGTFCDLVAVGAPVGEEDVPITWAAPGAPGALSEAQLAAVDLVLAQLRGTGGDYLAEARQAFFPLGDRPACAAQDAADAAATAALAPASRLEAIDLAGAFVLQGIGLALGALCHVSKGHRRRVGGAFAARAPLRARVSATEEEVEVEGAKGVAPSRAAALATLTDGDAL